MNRSQAIVLNLFIRRMNFLTPSWALSPTSVHRRVVLSAAVTSGHLRAYSGLQWGCDKANISLAIGGRGCGAAMGGPLSRRAAGAGAGGTTRGGQSSQV